MSFYRSILNIGSSLAISSGLITQRCFPEMTDRPSSMSFRASHVFCAAVARSQKTVNLKDACVTWHQSGAVWLSC